jgi:hypothetical protein
MVRYLHDGPVFIIVEPPISQLFCINVHIVVEILVFCRTDHYESGYATKARVSLELLGGKKREGRQKW